MPLINHTVELKLKWEKYFVLSAAGADNKNADPNNIIFTTKDTTLCSCSNVISTKTIKRIWKISLL